MIYYEIRKVFCNLRACMLIVALIFTNLFLGIYFQYRDYGTVIKERTQLEILKEKLLSGEENRDSLQKKQEDLFAQVRAALYENGQYKNGQIGIEISREINLLGYYLEQYEEFEQYTAFSENLEARAKQMQTSSLWGNSDSFPYRNIQKTAADYEKLDVQLQIGINEGIEFLGNAFWTDWLLLLFSVYVGFMLFKWEKENDTLNLISSCVRGRGTLGTRKTAAGILIEAVAFLVLYGSNFAIAQGLYGFEDLERAIQSVPEFQTCGISLTVGEYILFLGILKSLSLIAVSMGIWGSILVIRGTLLPVCSIIGVLLIQYLLYTCITPLSKWRLLRYLNFFYFINGCEVITVYQNLNFFGYPVSFLSVWAGVLIVMAGGLLVLLPFSFIHTEKIQIKKRMMERFLQSVQRIKYKMTPAIILNSVWYWEIKIYFCKLGGLVLIGCCMLCMALVLSNERDSYVVSKQESVTEEFIQEYKGVLTEEKIRKIEEEYAYYTSLDEQLLAYEKEYADNRLTDEQIQGKRWIIQRSQERAAAFEEFYDQYKNLDEGACIVSQTALRNLMENNDTRMTADIVMMTVFVLAVSVCMSREFKNKSVFLVRSTKKGASATFFGRSVCVMVTAFVFCLFRMYLESQNIGNTFLFEEWNASIQSVLQMRAIPVSITIQQYIIWLAVCQAVCLWACGLFVISLSVYFRQFQRTVLAGMLIFTSPLILKKMNLMPKQSIFADYIFDTGKIWNMDGNPAAFLIYMTVLLMVSLCCLFFAWKRFRIDV